MRKKPLPYYERAKEPPHIDVTPRDKELFETILEYNGVLADYQINSLRFFKSVRRMKERGSLLYHNGYLNRFDRKERNSFDYMAYFLHDKAIEYLKQKFGENLRIRLKGERDSRIHHDVVVNDVRIALRAALATIGATLEESTNSLDFDSDHDSVTVRLPDGKTRRRAVIPDDFEHIVMANGRHRRYFIEVELARKDQPRLLEEKFRPQLTYVRESPEFKARFGEKSGGTWLYFVHDEKMALKMKKTAETLGEHSHIFCFTTYELALAPGNFFTAPIWLRATQDKPVALVNNLT